MLNHLSRRTLLKTTASGFGYIAFAGLASAAAEKEKAGPLAPKKPHFPAKAKRVIFLCMEGAPSHVDTFDHKPKLIADDGKPYSRGRFAGAKLLGPLWKFNQHGQSGLHISELYPELAKHADEMCIVNSMQTDQPNHPQAFVAMHTGIFQATRPSMGAWVLYGLGTENENVPGFITLSPPGQNGGPVNYGSAFLPAIYQGTPIRGLGGRGPGGGAPGGPGGGAPSISNISNPRQSTSSQRVQLDYVQELNRAALERDEVNPGIEGVIESYELAFRMQGELPKLLDLSKETEATKKLYGVDDQATQSFGRQCLLARRFVEAGVRFVELTHPGWDHHRDLKNLLGRATAATDKPMAGLIADLKSRGLLQDTLIIWGGEFGRTPFAQGNDGRDHNNKAYSTWLAGGGVKGGLAYGQSDDYGYEAVEKPVHVHDWHATILHLLGFDHEKLTYRYAGREMRLTDVKGNVVKGIVS